jgi:hypothetical protein
LKEKHENLLAQTLIGTQIDNVIAVFFQTELIGRGKIILSYLRLEHYWAEFNDKSLKLPGGVQ